MFKRANKITALLVAAASVMSIVPAMAATKLATKDGSIDNAVAFKDGKYLYEGYRTDDDDNGLYYNDGGQDKKLDDATTFASSYKFDNKNVMVQDGSDDYVVDLETGKVSDEDTASDLIDTAATKLQNKLKKTSRYGSAVSISDTDLTKIDANKFGDVWYEYTDSVTGFEGYTNASGTYLDASHNVNLYLYSTTSEAMVKVKNVGDNESGAKIVSISNGRTLAQDDKYIYRLADVAVTGASATDSTEATLTTVTVLQKISKAQGDTKDDAYLPKSTDSFIVSKNTGCGDADKAAEALALADPTNDLHTNALTTNVYKAGTKVTAVDGTIYVTYTDGSKVKTEKLLLRTSEKLDQYKGGAGVAVKQTTKVDAHLVKKDTDKDTDATAWSVDVNGNVWAINKGEIKKSTKCGDFETVYTCDRSINSLDVYDENNIIAWESGSDVYTTVTEGKKAAADEAATIVQPTPAKIGWDKLTDGSWNFYDATGTKQVNKWVNAGGYWYFLKADGVMATGWYKDNGTWYYLNASGAMATGWFKDTDGNWYYLNASGAMLANTVVDGYKLGASGAWVK